jgi:hypothetical protein
VHRGAAPNQAKIPPEINLYEYRGKGALRYLSNQCCLAGGNQAFNICLRAKPVDQFVRLLPGFLIFQIICEAGFDSVNRRQPFPLHVKYLDGMTALRGSDKIDSPQGRRKHRLGMLCSQAAKFSPVPGGPSMRIIVAGIAGHAAGNVGHGFAGTVAGKTAV